MEIINQCDRGDIETGNAESVGSMFGVVPTGQRETSPGTVAPWAGQGSYGFQARKTLKKLKTLSPEP